MYTDDTTFINNQKNLEALKPESFIETNNLSQLFSENVGVLKTQTDSR